MSSTANRITRKHYFLAYTAGAFVMFAIIIGIFASCSKSFITNGDGANQHYIGLMYYGSYLREILKNIFIYHRLEIPMWDMKIGYGMDVLTTLHYYTIGDPLNLLSALVPRQYTEYLYDFLILVRIYLAGITFSIYCFYHKNKPATVWLGAMMYIFTHWTFVAGLPILIFSIRVFICR